MAKEIHRTTPRRYVVEFFSDMGEWVPDSAFFTASEAISFAEDMAEGFAREYRVMDLEADDEGGADG